MCIKFPVRLKSSKNETIFLRFPSFCESKFLFVAEKKHRFFKICQLYGFETTTNNFKKIDARTTKLPVIKFYLEKKFPGVASRQLLPSVLTITISLALSFRYNVFVCLIYLKNFFVDQKIKKVTLTFHQWCS